MRRPCAHFVCIACHKQLTPTKSVQDSQREQQLGIAGTVQPGMTCPVCRTHFPKHGLTEHPAAPGGVAIFEKV